MSDVVVSAPVPAPARDTSVSSPPPVLISGWLSPLDCGPGLVSGLV